MVARWGCRLTAVSCISTYRPRSNRGPGKEGGYRRAKNTMLLHPRITSHPRTFFSFVRNTHAHTSTARRTPRTQNACGKPPTRSKQQGERATQQSAARLTKKKKKVKPATP